jgi:hypothetical protein
MVSDYRMDINSSPQRSPSTIASRHYVFKPNTWIEAALYEAYIYFIYFISGVGLARGAERMPAGNQGIRKMA